MEGYLGQIILFTSNYVPKYWMACDGREVEFKDYVPLGAVLGKEFPDGIKYNSNVPTGLKFNLPLLESPRKEVQYIICVNGNFPSRT